METGIKAIIFDMDGVLIDAKDWHYEALNQALTHFSYAPIPRNQHLEAYDGLPTQEKLKQHPETKHLPAAIHQKINQQKQRYTTALVQEKCTPYPPHQRTLQQLKAKGFKLAVCSNSIRQSVHDMLEKAHIHPYIEFFLSNEDVERPKPYPDMYSEAMRRLGLLPDQVLVCEDNIKGITAAMRSGANILEISSIDDVSYKNIEQAIRTFQNDSQQHIIRPPIRTARLSEMAGGWFVGDFFPNILQSKQAEVAIKEYKKGDTEAFHVHKVGTEITVILEGKAKMAGRTLTHGDIILIEPGHGTSFTALTDLKTVVVKTPSVPGDKYFKRSAATDSEPAAA